MAITNEAECKVCGRTFTTIGDSDICFSCYKKKRLEEKVEWLTKRKYDYEEDRPKTLEERIDWIEEWIFDHKDELERRSISKHV